MLFSNHPEAARAEIEYRQARIAEDFRRANGRRDAKRAAERADEEAALLAAEVTQAEPEQHLTEVGRAA